MINDMLIEYSDLDDDLIDFIIINDIELEYHNSEAYFTYGGKLYIIRHLLRNDIDSKVREYKINDILK